MRAQHCTNKDGERFTLWQTDEGMYCCPVCGSPEHTESPYDQQGRASFQICSCGFEFGYDDSPLATDRAVEGVEANWDRWRLELIDAAMMSKETLTELMRNLERIGIELAFDLIPVKRGRPLRPE